VHPSTSLQPLPLNFNALPLHNQAGELGLQLNPNRRVVNTLKAFCTVNAAPTHEQQRAVFQELSDAYFTHAEDISETAVLVAAAARAGLDGAARHPSAFAADIEAARPGVVACFNSLVDRVTEVPTILLRNGETGEQVKLTGAQPLATFERAIEQVLRGPSPPSTAANSTPAVVVTVPGFGAQPVRLAHANPLSCASLHAAARRGYFPEQWPYGPDAFRRRDETVDTVMYSQPRLVSHLDDASIQALTNTYRELLCAARVHKKHAPLSLLDVCSSWQSHYPTDALLPEDRVAVLGLNAAELDANQAASEKHVQDLNISPKLSFASGSFDFVTNTASVDYLVDPRAVLSETHRVLRPGGVAVIAFSNRCFDSKATAIWLERIATGAGLMHLVSDFLHFSADWSHISTIDATPAGAAGDPMWIVTAVKKTQSRL
jgi:hypothetical protein